MANMSLKKNPMPSQEPDVRNKNFDEVALGYTAEMAIDEAQRCLNCKNPKCVNGCPVNVHIPEFISKVAEGKFDEAFGVITSTNSLPAICGRVCPQENQCEGQCVRGIKGEPVGIGRLERFVADYHNAHGHQGGAPTVPESNGHKVAVVGSGPAGLTCAGDLARKGYDVTVFEALHQVGGVLVYGIPEFRLPKAIVAKEVARLEHFGVKIMKDTVVGRTITVDELMEEQGFEAVFIGSGAGLPMFMDIPGVNYKGVLSANEFLTRINLMKAYLPDSDTPSFTPGRGRSWAEETWLWTRPAAPSAWGLRSTWFTAAVWRNCPPERKKWSTPRRRASFSRPSATRWKFWPMRTTMSRAFAASGWSWGSLTPLAAAGPLRSPAASSTWTWTA